MNSLTPTRKVDAPVSSVIIVTWNGKRYVEECLHSLTLSADIPTEVLVVDNASTDGTPDLVARAFPEFSVTRNTKNLGFAKANNIGIRLSRGKYLCLVNSDVVLPPGCLSALLDYMEANPDVAVAGPQMLGVDHAVHRSTMRLPSLTNAFCRAFALDRLPLLSQLCGGQLMAEFSHDYTSDVEVLNGWFWIIRREAVEQVGLLDERFFMYGEDLDWCRRFRKAGWRLVFYAGARALHYGAASSSAAPVRFYVEMQRANLQYWRKHHGTRQTATYCGILVIHHLIRVIAHSAACLVSVERRAESVSKIKRSWRLMAWLTGAWRPILDGR